MQDEIGLSGPTRQELVFAQFKAARVCVFALQETRLKRTAKMCSDYLIYKGEATPQGHHVIIAAISTSIPYGHTSAADGHRRKLCFTGNDVSIICAEARYLLLRVCTPWIRFVLIAAHAPHSGNTAEELERWWTNLAALIPQKVLDWPILLLADANAKVGAETCELIGDHGAEQGDAKAWPFTSFLRFHSLWLPCTFSCHEGPTGTWRHPNGTWLRNDYVALPSQWAVKACSSWIATDIDVSPQHEDHRAALVRFSLDTVAGAMPNRMASLKFHAETADLTALRSAACIGPDVDVHTHAWLIQQQVAQCLPSHRPRGSVQRKTTLSATTWQLVLSKRQWRSALWEANALQRETMLQAVFTQWQRCAQHANIQEIDESATAFHALLHDQDRVIAKALFEFRKLGSLVTKATRADDVRFFQDLMLEGTQFLAPTAAHQLPTATTEW